MKSYLRGFLVAALLWCGIGPLFAAEQTNFLGTVFIADPTTTSYQLKVNSDGSINVDSSGGGGGAVTLPTTPTIAAGNGVVPAPSSAARAA